jgi:hypothetical protein
MHGKLDEFRLQGQVKILRWSPRKRTCNIVSQTWRMFKGSIGLSLKEEVAIMERIVSINIGNNHMD